MYLFKFDCNAYDSYYVVMAEDSAKALQAVKDYLKAKVDKYGKFRKDISGESRITEYWRYWEKWKDATLDNLPEPFARPGMPQKYTLEVFGSDVVLEDEHN